MKSSDVKNGNNVRIFFLLSLLLITGLYFFRMLSFFFVPVIMSFAFTTLLYPFYRKILKLFKNKANLASLITCLLVILVLLIPLMFLFQMILDQMKEIYVSLAPYFENIEQIEKIPLIANLEQSALFSWVNNLNIDWNSTLEKILSKSVNLLSIVLNKSSQGILQLITNFLITLFSMFYFFRDGEKLLEYLKSISPLKNAEESKLFDRFAQISRATVKGTLIIGIIQGGLGALTLMIFGVKTWILWGFVMIICATIPMVGSWVILVPASLIQMVSGHVWQGVVMFLISSLIIGNIDNLLRPILVGKDAKMHDLLIFFSTLGGIMIFGLTGFVIGPVITALFLSLIEIYKDEFEPFLNEK